MNQEQAYRIYDRVRGRFKENFEGCEWFLTSQGWQRENSKGKRMLVRGEYVDIRIKHDEGWITEERYHA